MNERESPVQRILVADDDASILHLFRLLADELGLACEAAEDGDQAEAALAHGPYACIFLDLYMPGTTTQELLSKAKRLYPDTPRMIITAEDNEESMRDAFALGATAYLTKPLRPGVLREIIAKHTAA
jgi:two-component system OmpR family response regulator